MTRARLVLALALALPLVLAGAGPAPGGAGADDLEDLLFDLQLIPLDGPPAPAFTLERLADGRKVSLADYRGRPVMLYFWATW